MDGFPSFTNVSDSRAFFFFTCFLSGFSWSWFLEGKIYPGPRAIHSKYSPYVLRKVLKTYAKFQKNMHLVLRKPLEEIFDIPILAIHFEWMKWYIHLLKHPSSLYQVYSDCRLLKVLCLLKTPKPTTINCFLETLLWTWGEERSQEKVPSAGSQEAFLTSSKWPCPWRRAGWSLVLLSPGSRNKDTLSFNKWPGWANYRAKENRIYQRIYQLRHFLPKLVRRAQTWWATCSQREQSQHFSQGAVLSGLAATFCLDLAPSSLSSATIHNTTQVSRKSPDCSQTCSCSKGWP